ncbi:hypothetical protein, partial [Psychroserpens mesophilus]|uniref:hypothetical protein n=1 Tax=Psychroserpens mesophilus TaxID=325473 RepID=UPI003D65FD42
AASLRCFQIRPLRRANFFSACRGIAPGSGYSGWCMWFEDGSGMADEGRLLDDNAVYRTLLESTKAIPWKIDWATMKFAYIGPQIEA